MLAKVKVIMSYLSLLRGSYLFDKKIITYGIVLFIPIMSMLIILFFVKKNLVFRFIVNQQ